MTDRKNVKQRLQLDHIAVVAPSLSEGVAYVRSKLGVCVPEGGRHPLMGTHNCLMQIGVDEYFEIIAIDPDAPKPTRQRWFGLDVVNKPTPCLATWILACHDIEAQIARAIPEVGESVDLSRDTLSWKISVAPTGQLPMSGSFPTLIEWPDAPHPASEMPNLGCSLTSLTIQHPHIGIISNFLAGMLDDPRIKLEQANDPKLLAELRTPQGLKLLT